MWQCKKHSDDGRKRMAKKRQSFMSETEFKTNPALERLGVLVGEWSVQMSVMSFHPDPSAGIDWRVWFEWLEGGRFIIQHEEVIRPDIPHGVWIIGPDD